MTNYKSQIQQWGKGLLFTLLLMCSNLLSAQVTDRELFDAYQREDMSLWKAYVDSLNTHSLNTNSLLYEYGYCGYVLEYDKTHATPYISRFRAHVEAQRENLPPGHYEMYMSAVYVYELRAHESFHPAKAMSLAKQATKLAPNDPLVLAYYATSLFYAPKPFGSKKEALDWFERAEQRFRAPQWKYCWVRAATLMYIDQCKEKLK